MKKPLFQTKSIRRMVIIVNAMIVCPLVLMFFLLLIIVVDGAIDSNNETKLYVLSDKSKNVMSANVEVTKIMDSIAGDIDINIYLSKTEHESVYQQLETKMMIEDKIRQLTSMYENGRYDIVVFGADGNSYFRSSINRDVSNISLETLKEEDWYSSLEKNRSQVFFLSAYQSEILSESIPNQSVFAVSLIRNFNSGRNIALVVVTMSKEMFEKDLLQFDSASEHSVMTDQNGEIIFTSDPFIYELDIKFPKDLSNVYQSESGYFTTVINGVSSDVRFVTVEDVGWKIVNYNNREYIITDYIIFTGILGITLLLVVVIMVNYNCKFIERKIRGINYHILTVTQGDLEARLKEESYESEFHELGQNFNSMLDSIQFLMKQLSEEEKQKYILEFKTLQAQINPHFLYNTLATIRFMIQMEQYENADLAIVTFSKLLRKSYSDNRVIITIEEEIASVEDYMRLMQIRHQNTFVWEIVIDSSIKQYGILKNTIQPIVENSISHGFNGKQTRGHLLIVGEREKAHIQIKIIDDGVGGNLEKINRQLAMDTTHRDAGQLTSIGISNVQQRIRYHFGEEYNLEAEINEQGGITFVITFPIVSMCEESASEYCNS